MLLLLVAATATTVATGLGAIPVFFAGPAGASALRRPLWGLAAGTMLVASIAGLLIPAGQQGSVLDLVLGGLAGVAFLVIARTLLGSRQRRGPLRTSAERSSILVFATLLVHSLPEGFAMGTAYASDTEGLALFVIVAIAVQNIPEGTSVALPMAEAGYSRSRQFWAATASSAPQPPGALIAFLAVDQVRSLLPLSLAFAGGAMLSLVLAELLPRAFDRGITRGPALGFASGALAMLALSSALGV